MENKKALGLVIFANVIFGCSFMATTVASEACGGAVFGLLAGRFLIAFLFLLALNFFGAVRVSYRGKPIRRLVGIALLYPGVYYAAETIALTQVDSAVVGVVIGMAPITTALLMMLLFRQKQTCWQLIFIILSIIGVAVINSGGFSGSGLSLQAILVLAVALLSFSSYSIGINRAGEDFSAAEITLFMLFAGTVLFSIADSIARAPGAYLMDFANIQFLIPVVFLGILASGLSSFALNYGLCHLSPVKVSVLNNVTSVIAVLCGLLFLREQLTLSSALGCGCILAGCIGYSATSGK